MALQKTPVNINFNQGLNTKDDPYQVEVGKFLALSNSIFDVQGRLTKRNGFPLLTTLPNTVQTTLTTLNGNLLATGTNILAFNQDLNQWFDKGKIQPIDLHVQSSVRSSASQTTADLAVASNGLALLAYMEGGTSYYQVADSVTNQQIVSRVALPAGSVNPRAYILGQYFIVTFVVSVGGSPHLQYVSIPVTKPASPNAATDLSTVMQSLNAGYDAIVANNNLYFMYGATSTSVRVAFLNSTLNLSASVTIAGSHSATLASITADTSASTAVIYTSFYDGTANNAYIAAFDQQLGVVLAPVQISTGQVMNEMTSIATAGSCTVFFENNNNYNSVGGYPSAVKTDFISKVAISQAGTVGSTTTILRSVGLASKAFYAQNGTVYLVVAYGETNQPTYFLIDATGAIYMRLAYSNGGGYQASQVLPSVTVLASSCIVPYLIKDLLVAVNKDALQNPASVPTGSPVNALYTQTGVNLATFSINQSGQYSSEIAATLHLTGGQLWQYDGVRPVEHGFHVYPENVAATTATTGGLITAQTYYYSFCYEWTDNQGNLHRSAPSIPLQVVTTGSTSANTLYVPTLRLTYKVSPNPVRIVGYRWSTAQQNYFQFTSITTPVLNDTTVDYVTIVDTKADSAILGSTLLYTTGGVVEDIAAPASSAIALFKNRLFLVDAEDRNLIWYSKQVIQSVPVEMSDLLTLYVAPTSGAQGSTGEITAISAMDDKLIIFKADAIYYLTGTGPDNTGANNDFTDPVFITSSVGCANPNSIVLMPTGLMFQSDKGIWMLGRDLSTTYVGNPVESYNANVVMSAQAIPTTNQVRFILDNSVTLMYDYYYQQWGTFSNIRAISSTLFQGMQTYLNATGQVFQEQNGTYLDGSAPVLMSFQTAWVKLAGLQGFQRFYEMYLLGTYFTPFKLNVGLSYDYNPNPSQYVMITPDNYSAPWGGENLWGGGESWGGKSNVFEARVFPQIQKCESFQITVQEIYDPSQGVAAGQGLALSGLNLITGVKRGSRTQNAKRSFG